MTEKERLADAIFRLLETIETDNNQPIVRQIKGLIYEFLNN